MPSGPAQCAIRLVLRYNTPPTIAMTIYYILANTIKRRCSCIFYAEGGFSEQAISDLLIDF